MNVFFMILVLPYLTIRRLCRLLLGRSESYRLFFDLGIASTCDFLAKLRFPEIVRTWIDVRTRLAFEKPVTDSMLRIRGKLLFDIGANMGYYSALLSKNFEKIVAFEPHPENLKMLNSTVVAGRLGNVIIVDKAVSDGDGNAILHTHRKRVQHSIMDSRTGPGLTVQTTKLDSVIEKTVDLIKVDVEEAEWKVVKGAENSIRAGKILRWVIEIDRPDSHAEFEKYLQQRNYSTRWLDSRHLFASLGTDDSSRHRR